MRLCVCCFVVRLAECSRPAQFYYVFGFLLLVFIILIITCAEITIVMCYFQLCAEDYHWWWRAFLTSGSSAAYMFIYSIFYFFTKLEITKFVSVESPHACLRIASTSCALCVFFFSFSPLLLMFGRPRGAEHSSLPYPVCVMASRCLRCFILGTCRSLR